MASYPDPIPTTHPSSRRRRNVAGVFFRHARLTTYTPVGSFVTLVIPLTSVAVGKGGSQARAVRRPGPARRGKGEPIHSPGRPARSATPNEQGPPRSDEPGRTRGNACGGSLAGRMTWNHQLALGPTRRRNHEDALGSAVAGCGGRPARGWPATPRRRTAALQLFELSPALLRRPVLLRACQQQCKTCYKLVYDTVLEKRWHTCYQTVQETVMKQVCKTCYREECRTCYKTCYETCYKTVAEHCCKPCYEDLLEGLRVHRLQAVLQDLLQGSLRDGAASRATRPATRSAATRSASKVPSAA